MSSFLRLLAESIIQKYDGHFEQLTIVFPNKRAALFLAEELSGLTDKPVWMPEIITLDEFIGKHSGLHKIDDLPLIIKLYKAYTDTAHTNEKFEDFYFWGNMLLGDFDDIDKYLANAKAVFSNLTALKELELNFPYLSTEQIEIIQSFWSCFNPEKYSKEQLEFLKIWNNLYPAYTKFRNTLTKEKICYEGMGQRHFYEHIEEFDVPGHIIFAGFNALNLCEKKIFSFYQDKKQASFYWDYDIYYSTDENHEAGKYIRENLKAFPNELGPEHFNNFRHNGKNIEYISVPSVIGQAKLIPQLTAGLEDKDNRNTAIVLCDERMLIPTIHSVPDDIKKINITMGYPAQNTSVAALISMVGDLKNYAKKEGEQTYYYYKPVIALLNHKLIKDSCPEDINTVTDRINRKNRVYIAAEDLLFTPVTQAIFSHTDKNIPDYLLHILELLSQPAKDQENSLHPLEKEFIFTLYTSIQTLRNTFREENIEPDEKLYMQIITKVINATSIPFSGEPLEGLQLMGLMETRMLDFKNLIILSANEGIIPKNGVISSFIPYTLRVGFKLPTPEHQDALFAYYFYRLLQRGKNIKILYTNSAKGLNSGEMSRFLYQIKYESGLPIKESNFQNQISVQENKAISIEKNEEILRQLSLYTQPDNNPLSPSALNTYMECPLRFYFRYIANIKEKEEMAEELDHRLLGNIFHDCSCTLYATVPNGDITIEAIDTILKNNGLIEAHIKASYLKVYDQQVSKLINSGSNELILNIIKKYIRQMLSYDKQICPFHLIAMEEKFSVPVTIKTGEQETQVHIGGVIDRVDNVGNNIRVIDYKTGVDTTLFKNISSLFEKENTTRNKAAFQTLLYCLMYEHDSHTLETLTPGIYSTKLLFSKDYNYRLKCDKDYVNNFGIYREEFLGQLEKLLEEIYSPAIPFCQTTVEKKCRNCSYNRICQK